MILTPSEVFSLLSDETRLRCLLLLKKEKELCVCELAHILKGMQPKISRHLAHLRKSGLVLDERRGQWVYYRFNQEVPHWILLILRTTLHELKNTEPYRSDFVKADRLQEENLCSRGCYTNPCK